MTMTLWRGDELLGELVPQPNGEGARADSTSRGGSLSAFLLPAQGVRLNGLMQATLSPEFGSGVQQHPVAPHTLGESTSGTGGAGKVSAKLRPASPEAIAGVPPSRQLTVRTGDGASMLPQHVSVHEVRVPAATPQQELDEIPRGALVDGRTWTVLIVFAPG